MMIQLLEDGAGSAHDEYREDDHTHSLRRQLDIVLQHKFNANKHKNKAKSVLQRVKHINHIANDEEHGSQSKHRQNRGAICNVIIRDLSDLRADAIDCKKNVSHLETENHRNQ